MKSIKRYFITGLLIWVPLAITAWVLSLIVRTMDQSLLLLPHAVHPEHLLGIYIPGVGALLTLMVVFLTGLVTANIVGQRLVRFWEALLARIPVVKSIYYSVKQVSDTLFSGSGEAFRKVLLVRYPHPEAWSVAFQTGTPPQEIARYADDELVSVFIPTAPSPVNGFFFFVRKRDTVELDISVDDALKYIVSMGVVAPVLRNPNLLGAAQNE
ncbi:hypothetical protein RHDC4_00977 [Rhodocyclaceae bacterium]|nr:hypothetical protein RHDC4_00977 [Rhodocyclaceae bacterium]